MAGKIILRDLFVRIGFDVDAKALDELNVGINRMKSSVKTLTIALAAATAGLIFFLNEGGKFEQAQISFEVMLGSAERAGVLIKDLFEFAAKRFGKRRIRKIRKIRESPARK